MIERGIRGDQTGQLLICGEPSYLERLFVPKIRSDLDEEAGVRVFTAQSMDNITQAMSFLQFSQSGRIR